MTDHAKLVFENIIRYLKKRKLVTESGFLRR